MIDYTSFSFIVLFNLFSAFGLTLFVIGIARILYRNSIVFKYIAFLMMFVAYAAELSVIIAAIEIDYPSEWIPSYVVAVPVSMVFIYILSRYFYRLTIRPIDKSVNTLTLSTSQLVLASEGINASSQSIASTIQTISKATNEQRDLIIKALENVKELQTQFKDNLVKLSSASSLIQEFTIEIKHLSTNVSIEAAHAGEYGKGFEFIAGDIQNLVQQTSNSLKEINTLIKQVDSTLSTSLTTIITSFENLSRFSQETAVGAEEVSGKVQEQTAAVEEFSSNFTQLDNTAQILSELTTGSSGNINKDKKILLTTTFT